MSTDFHSAWGSIVRYTGVLRPGGFSVPRCGSHVQARCRLFAARKLILPAALLLLLDLVGFYQAPILQVVTLHGSAEMQAAADMGLQVAVWLAAA